MVADLLHRFPTAQTRSMGSSLKFCLVAEGMADLYLRDVPTMEWDTAAAQCVVEQAGGCVQDLEGQTLSYNRENLRSPSLITMGDPSFDWRVAAWKKPRRQHGRSGGMTSTLLLTKARIICATSRWRATHLRSMAGPSLRKAWKHFLKTHLSVAAKASSTKQGCPTAKGTVEALSW